MIDLSAKSSSSNTKVLYTDHPLPEIPLEFEWHSDAYLIDKNYPDFDDEDYADFFENNRVGLKKLHFGSIHRFSSSLNLTYMEITLNNATNEAESYR